MEAKDYAQQLALLLPRGRIWEVEKDSRFERLLLGLSEEFARIDQRAKDLIKESLPSQIQETLERWEKDLGLPEDAAAPGNTDQRIAAVVHKYSKTGTQKRDFFLSIAVAMGMSAEIIEYKQSDMGDDFGGYFYSSDWAFVVEVVTRTLNVPDETLLRMRTTMRKYLHAHKVLITRDHDTKYLSVNGQLLTINGKQLAATHERVTPLA